MTARSYELAAPAESIAGNISASPASLRSRFCGAFSASSLKPLAVAMSVAWRHSSPAFARVDRSYAGTPAGASQRAAKVRQKQHGDRRRLRVFAPDAKQRFVMRQRIVNERRQVIRQRHRSPGVRMAGRNF